MNARPDSETFAREGTVRVALEREGTSYVAWVHSLGTEAFDRLRQSPRDFLQDEEADHFLGLRFERRQRSYLLGRYAAKRAALRFLADSDPSGGTERLAATPGFEPISAVGGTSPLRGSESGDPIGSEPVDPRRLQIVRGVFGQPILRASDPNVPGICISHSEQWVCAIAYPQEHPIGVDVEEVGPDRARVIRSQLTDDEIRWTEAGAADSLGRSTLVWTAKEALSKVLRCGLTTPMRILEVAEPRGLDDCITEGLFHNFGQYKFVAFANQHRVVTFVLPKRTTMRIDGRVLGTST